MDIQQEYLQTILKKKLLVNIFLVNGVKLIGYILRYDKYCIVLSSQSGSLLLYKHAISTIAPENFNENSNKS